MRDDLLFLIASKVLIGSAVAFGAQLLNAKREIIGGYPLIALFSVIGAFMGAALPYLLGFSLVSIKQLGFMIDYGIPFLNSAIFALFFSRVLRKW